MTVSNQFSTIFVHIPKTAGTTLRAIIESHYPEDQICSIYQGNFIYLGREDFQKIPAEEKKKFQIFCGHFEFGLHSHLPQPCKYITVLRDPVERIISLYHHHLNKNHFRTDKNAVIIQSQLKSGELSLADFVASGMSLQTDNWQTRFLSGDLPEFGQCTREMLENAKANLREHFLVTGITERFDESVLLMQKALSWSPPYYVSKNISSDRSQKEELDPSTLDAIMRYNDLDAELYSFAEELLDEQFDMQGADFKNELADFKIANRQFAERSKKWGRCKKALSKIRNLKKFIKLKLQRP
jgi:hypothetical protein